MGFVILLLVIAVGCTALWWWFQWDEGEGIAGQIKRDLAFNRAKRASDEIAKDGKRRIQDL